MKSDPFFVSDPKILISKDRLIEFVPTKSMSLEEKLTTYVFRYTYANVAKQLGYSKDLIAEALGHEYGNSVTGIYLEQFDLKVVDNMNQALIEAVSKPE